MHYQSENFNGTCDYRCGMHDNFFVDAHIHEYSEILFCSKNSAEIFVNGQKIIIPENHLIFIPPNYIHEFNCNAPVTCAVFSNDLIPLFFKELGNKRLSLQPVSFSHVPDLPIKLYTLNRETPLAVSSVLCQICDTVLKSSTLTSSQPGDGVLYQKVISYLAEHFKEDITLKAVATKFGYNEKYLSYTLHQLTGINFKRLVALYRINHAKELLMQDKKMSISYIALSCGFSALNTFNRVFKEFTGVTPSEYKNTPAHQKI